MHRERCYAPALIAQVRGSSFSSAAAAAAGAEEQAPHGTYLLGFGARLVGAGPAGGIETPVLFRALPEVLDPSPFRRW